MKVYQVELAMESYIAHPYWPSRERVIRISKDSGMTRQKSDEKRDAALAAQLDKDGLTMDQYKALLKEAARQWYTAADGEIIIPRHHLAGSLVQTVGTSPKGLRGSLDKDSFRAIVQLGDFRTGKTAADGVFSRYVKLEGSNMRSFQENEFIGNCALANVFDRQFVAVGTISLPDDSPDALPDTVKRLLTVAVEKTGLGAARKMGFGRGAIQSWKAAK